MRLPLDRVLPPACLRAAACLVLAALAACGGGRTGPDRQPSPDPHTDVRRFLTQATFGGTETDVSAVNAAGASAWLETQFNLPASGGAVPYLQRRQLQLAADPRGGYGLGPAQFLEYFHATAVTAPDQLRQRVAFALSQIFVVSLRNDNLSFAPLLAASYYDTLTADAFGNFRTLLEDVTLHPAMGCYLSSLQNLPEDPVSGRQPDENFAREVMQLMSIGLVMLHPDGSPKLDDQGNPIPTYSHDDVAGLAKVFTGMGWYAPVPTEATFWGGIGAESQIHPMLLYPAFHSMAEKRFLGATLPAAASPDPSGDLRAALDALFTHPNVGPFLGRRLIQQLVTSNPSPAYVARVSAVFADNGRGVRGDLRAVVRAILLDPEARDLALSREPAYGKLREPLLRLTQWARAFRATSQSGCWQIGDTSPASYALGQAPLAAPSVFNFWRPGYVPPLPEFAGSGLVAPEFQGVNEVSVVGYLNFLWNLVGQGVGGGAGASPATQGPDVRAGYAVETALATDPGALADHLDRLLLCGTMSSALRSQVVTAVAGVPLPAGDTASARQGRAKLAVLLVMASPEYLHQR